MVVPLKDYEEAKIFVGGLKRVINEDRLKKYFEKYGPVKEVLVLMDKITGNSRRFGFVTFENSSIAKKVLQLRHVISGKQVDVKPSIPKSHREPKQEETQENNNEFIGGLPPNIKEEDMRNFFEKLGTVTDVVVMHDKITGKSRGFGFITFDSEDTVENILRPRYYELNGYNMEVKKAKPKIERVDNRIYYSAPYNAHYWVYPTAPAPAPAAWPWSFYWNGGNYTDGYFFITPPYSY